MPSWIRSSRASSWPWYFLAKETTRRRLEFTMRSLASRSPRSMRLASSTSSSAVNRGWRRTSRRNSCSVSLVITASSSWLYNGPGGAPLPQSSVSSTPRASSRSCNAWFSSSGRSSSETSSENSERLTQPLSSPRSISASSRRSGESSVVDGIPFGLPRGNRAKRALRAPDCLDVAAGFADVSLSLPRTPVLSETDQPGGSRPLGPLLAAVTNAVVRLHRIHYGKGPTRSKSYLMDDVLICVMGDVLTTVERTLIEAGEVDRVRDTRLAFQDAMQDVFKGAVEEILGRPVLGYTSQVLVDEAVAVELFVLGPGELSAAE